MITYVNTVLVGKGAGRFSGDINTLKYATRAAFDTAIATNANKIVVERVDDSKFRVGIITNKAVESYIEGTHEYRPLIKWSNFIKKADIKSFHVTNYNAAAATEDTVVIDFADASALTTLAEGNKRVVLRLTFKDLPTRFRKWTESYEYVTKEKIMPGETLTSEKATEFATEIAAGLADQIVKNYKRARIDAVASGTTLTLTALPYDDDNTVDSISLANKVRFSANVWYTNPQATGFDSKNKYAVGCSISKTPGVHQVGEWKLVRDAEAQAMGYQGILNRGECTWPIIKPDMNTENGATYDSLTLEFENMYRTADDLHRKTKQTLQIFEKSGEEMANIATAILAAAGIDEDNLPEISRAADVQAAQA